MKTILVTGGYGFIGSNFIKHVLINTNYSVVNVDKNTAQAHLESLNEIKSLSRYESIEIDICDISRVCHKLHRLHHVLQDIKYIVNFAAETHVDRSIGAWEKGGGEGKRWGIDAFIHTNVYGVQCLLELARKIKGFKRFVQISTDEVYGSVKSASFECDQFNTTNPYSATKGGGELMANAYYHTFGVPVSITRSCNNYGIWQGSEKLIPLTILRALEDKPIPVYGTGKNKRDWIYVDDNIRAILHVMENGKDGKAYNIPGYNTMSNNYLIKMILEMLGKPESLMVQTQDRPGHDWEYKMDGGLMTEFGWHPETMLIDGMTKTIAFYKENAEYFKEEQVRSGVVERVDALLEGAK